MVVHTLANNTMSAYSNPVATLAHIWAQRESQRAQDAALMGSW